MHKLLDSFSNPNLPVPLQLPPAEISDRSSQCRLGSSHAPSSSG